MIAFNHIITYCVLFALEQTLATQEEIAELRRGRSQSFMRQETLVEQPPPGSAGTILE